MPDTPRYYCPHPESGVLDQHESHHARAVLRQEVSEPIIVFDGKGKRWEAKITEVKKSGVRFELTDEAWVAPEPAVKVCLALGIPKPKAMEWILAKAVELGAAAIAPLVTARTVAEPPRERIAARQEKWRRELIAAAKQCGQDWLPELWPAQPLEKFLAENAASDSLCLVGSLAPGARPMRAALRENAAPNVVWLVGPEGDFTLQELSAAQAAGFLPVTLGPLVLRCDTAAVYGLVAVGYEVNKI